MAGFYCTGAAEKSNPVSEAYGDRCPVGHFCPVNTSSPVPCPAGTYQPEVQMTNDSACLPCAPGMFCNQTGAENMAGKVEGKSLVLETGLCKASF